MNITPNINSNHKIKRERLEARLSPELKSRLQYAADLQGSSLTEFILRSAESAANEVIREKQIIKLNAEDSLAIIKALLNPPKPNKKLRSEYLNYKKAVSSDA